MMVDIKNREKWKRERNERRWDKRGEGEVGNLEVRRRTVRYAVWLGAVHRIIAYPRHSSFLVTSMPKPKP